MAMRLLRPLLLADGAVAGDARHAGWREAMVEQRIDAAETLLAKQFFAIEAPVGAAKLGVALVRHLAQLEIRWHASPPTRLQIAAQRLVALDSLEQRLEVALAEAPRAFPLDDLEKDRRTILHVLRENLEQVAIVVAVHQDAEVSQLADVLID